MISGGWWFLEKLVAGFDKGEAMAGLAVFSARRETLCLIVSVECRAVI